MNNKKITEVYMGAMVKYRPIGIKYDLRSVKDLNY